MSFLPPAAYASFIACKQESHLLKLIIFAAVILLSELFIPCVVLLLQNNETIELYFLGLLNNTVVTVVS